MEFVKKRLSENYHLTNYQIAQLTFLFKTIGSEVSKMLIMGILFHDCLLLYFFALFVMLCLRYSTGGLHFDTYTGCLLASFSYLWLAIILLPQLPVTRNLKSLLLVICILCCCAIGPVTSKYRPALLPERFRKLRNGTCFFIFLYTILLYIMPDNPCLTVGFWIIILHSLQLIAAKIYKKGGEKNDSNIIKCPFQLFILVCKHIYQCTIFR